MVVCLPALDPFGVPHCQKQGSSVIRANTHTHTFCEVCGQRSGRSDEVYCAKVQRSGRGPSEEDAERCDEEEGAG